MKMNKLNIPILVISLLLLFTLAILSAVRPIFIHGNEIKYSFGLGINQKFLFDKIYKVGEYVIFEPSEEQLSMLESNELLVRRVKFHMPGKIIYKQLNAQTKVLPFPDPDQYFVVAENEAVDSNSDYFGTVLSTQVWGKFIPIY